MTRTAALAAWYAANGRHDLPWRETRDRWAVLVSEVMLAQTQVPRVVTAWTPFMHRFPTPEAMAAAGPGAVIAAWDRLGYPRRARRLWESAVIIAENGWPDDLRVLPGVGRYTAAAVRAQADDADVPAVEVNIRRVVERCVGRRISERECEAESIRLGRGLHGRDRLLALMDVGAVLCKPRDPQCPACPLARRCTSRGPLEGETRHRQGAFAGSFRQRRGQMLAMLRGAPTVRVDALDAQQREALDSLVADGLAVIDGRAARLP